MWLNFPFLDKSLCLDDSQGKVKKSSDRQQQISVPPQSQKHLFSRRGKRASIANQDQALAL